MIWIVIALLTGIGALSVLWPLARVRGQGHQARSISSDFYQAQLAELERDLDRGLLAAGEYAAAKAETARRLIASQTQDTTASNISVTNRRVAAVIAIVLLPAIALGLYARIGKPALADRPLQARLNAPPGKIELVAAVVKIEKHLARFPSDATGWQVIAPVYRRLGRYNDAALAWSKVIAILGPSPQRYSAHGEALVFAAGGNVTPAALAAFNEALKLDATFNQALYFSGVAAEQAGDQAAAREKWSRLIAAAPKGSPWIKSIEQRIAALDKTAEPQRPSDKPRNGPDSEAGKSIMALPKDEQAQAIRTMVQGLAARLQTNDKDLPGWLMLIRAYSVLKEPAKARDAAKKAKSIFSADTSALEKIDAQTRQLDMGDAR